MSPCLNLYHDQTPLKMITAVRGADVLHVSSPSLPDLPTLDLDTTRGKRTTQLDLSLPSSLSTLSSLMASTSIFLQSYRPSSLASRFPGHLSAQAIRALNPHAILVSLDAYGGVGDAGGPWGGKRGFDSLVQTATGLNVAESEAFALAHGRVGTTWGFGEDDEAPLEPRALPVQALDHAAGQLLAFGMLASLCRQITVRHIPLYLIQHRH